GEQRFQRRPLFLLAGVGEQILNDGAALGRLLHWEESLARDPAVLLSEVPASALFAQADDHVDAVVFHVERLTPALHAIAEHGHGLIAENLLEALRGIVGSLDHGFLVWANLNLAHR